MRLCMRTCVCTAGALHVHMHCMCTACALRVHCVCTACALRVHCVCTACALHVHTACALHVHVHRIRQEDVFARLDAPGLYVSEESALSYTLGTERTNALWVR